jgi:crossover junction endodeoxyribonuclease RuvC
MTRIIGIDPGVNGAIACVDTAEWSLAISDMPLELGTGSKKMVSAKGVIDAIRQCEPDHAILELVHSSPQQGVVSVWSFAEGYGCVKAAVLAHDVSLWPVRPQDWKAAIKCPKDKKQATTRASQLFPSAHSLFYGPRGGAFDGRAEAAMLALYGCLLLKISPDRVIKSREWYA